MEFLIDSPNIQVKTNEAFNISELDQILIYKYNSTSLEQLNKKLYYILDISINLNDYYLINNVKLNLETNQNNNQNENNANVNDNILTDIILSQILFSNPDNQNTNKSDSQNNSKYEIPFYYNPDKEDILLNQNNEISIFCIGATNHICFRFLVKKKIKIEEITVNKKYIKKYIIYSQYIYSIPNATFLMTLLNLKNFFYNLKNNKEINSKNKNNEIARIKNNYYCSMYLTAISMIQARLFIQAWEMLTNLQNEILDFDDKVLEKNKFLKRMFEISNCKFVSNKNSKNICKEKSLYLTKLELIKAICMFEHGHIQIFLDCLKNSIDIFYNNKYTSLNKNICLNKINEIAQDKIHIQSVLALYGNQIVDILINFLKDKNEMILYSVLKIFEFFIDYNPVIAFSSIHKIIEFISKVSFTINYNKKKLNNNINLYNNYLIKDEDEECNNNISGDNNNENKLAKIMKEKFLLFPNELYNNFKKEQKSSKDNNQNNLTRENGIDDIDINNNIFKFNSISQILQKQINYTLDTIIQNISNFDSSVINNILKTCSQFLFSIIKIADKDTLIYVSSLKILKKCYENTSSNLYYMNYRNIFNLFLFGIKTNLKDIFKEYIKIQNNIYKNTTDLHTTKKLKENIQYMNMKNNYINTLLNTNGLIENNDYGNLITIIFDRISENYLNDFSVKNKNQIQKNNKIYGGINYISNCTRYIQVCLETLKMIKNEEMQNVNNNNINIDSDFLIFYLYLILEFLIIIYLPNGKNDIKKALLSFYLGKDSKEKALLFQKLNELINILFDLEQYTLTNLSSYILFEPTLDILSRIKFLYKTNNNNNSKIHFPSYDEYFLKQYELVYNFISKKGITYDNIKYLLKTLPLTDFENTKFISCFKKIFSIFLVNFDNYYTEESFSLFSLSLEKISNFIDEKLFSEITLAILNKSNYKGKIFNQCYQKYNEIIIYSENNKNFEFMMKQFGDAIKDYKNEMLKNKGNKIMFKNKYIKFIDWIELMRKFYEYIKNTINDKNENEMWKYILFEQKEIMEIIIDAILISDDTTISKFNSLLLENVLYFDYKNNINKEEKNNETNNNENKDEQNNEGNKENEDINNNGNINSNYINNFTITDIDNGENNNNLYTSNESLFFKKMIINNEYLNEYFKNVNSKYNLYLFKDNLKLMNKIINIINNISNSYISLSEKYILYTKYYSSINNKLILNSGKIPNLLEELLLFYYQISIAFNNDENYENNNFKEYILILQSILFWAFNLNDKEKDIDHSKQKNCTIEIFGIEMLLKLFNIKFNLNNISIINKINNSNDGSNSLQNKTNVFNFTNEEITKIKTNVSFLFKNKIFSNFIPFFEKLVKLLDNDNYQIFFLLEFTLNLIVPNEMRKNLEENIKSLNINYVWMDNNDDLIDLFNFIKEKISNNKIMNNENNSNNSDLIGFNLDDDYEKDDGYVEKDIIVDEVNDGDNDIENLNDNYNLNYNKNQEEDKEEEINIIQQVNNINGNDIINQINNIKNIDSREIITNLINNGNINPELFDIIYPNNNIENNINRNVNNTNNNIENNANKNNNNDDDDLSLEDLGVKEVDDDIFGENFDESKVPILKKNCVRCKGYAAKFKTNQNSRPLLMSEHVRGNNLNCNSNNDSNNTNNNSINNNLIMDNNINSTNNNNNNENIINNNINNNIHFPDVNLNNNNILNGNNGVVLNNSEEKEKTESDFNDAPDLTQKKKNIRPLNGFRPATPPLKDAYTQQNSSSNTNFNNILINNNDKNIINNINVGNKNKAITNKNNDINNHKSKEREKERKEKAKNASISGKHANRTNRAMSKQKEKNCRRSVNKNNRSKSEERIKKVKYELKGVEMFLRKNKKNIKSNNNDKHEHKRKISDNNNNKSKNKKNSNNINTKKNGNSKPKNENINKDTIKNKSRNNEENKIQNNDEDDDIIFGENLQFNINVLDDKNNERNHNKTNKQYQRPSDKERKIPKNKENINQNNISNNLNNNYIKASQQNKINHKEQNINKNSNKKSSNIFSSFNEVISQKEFNNNLKNTNNKNKRSNSNSKYNKEIAIPFEKKSEGISFNIKQLVNECFSAKNIKNENELYNNFVNHSGIFPRNEINNLGNNYNKDRAANRSVDLFYAILNKEKKNNPKEVKNKKIDDEGKGSSYNNFIDKNNKFRNKGK